MIGSVLGVQAEGVAGTKALPDAGGSLHGVFTEPHRHWTEAGF